MTATARRIRPTAFLCLSLLLVAALSIVYWACKPQVVVPQEGKPLSITLSTGAAAAAGDTVSVTISVDSMPSPLAEAEVNLSYDAARLSPVALESRPGIDARLKSDGKTATCVFIADSAARFSGSNVALGALSFAVIAGTAPGKAALAPGASSIKLADKTSRTASGPAREIAIADRRTDLMARPDGMLRTLRGPDLYTPMLNGQAVQVNEKNADSAYRPFLLARKAELKAEPADLRLASARMTGKGLRISYQQTYKGLQVWHASVGLVTDAGGKVLSVSSNAVDKIALDITPGITVSQAAEAARKTYEGTTGAGLKPFDTLLIVYPERKEGAVAPRLAWKLMLAADRPNPQKDRYFIVDAKTGAVLHSWMRYGPAGPITGTITGQVFPINPTSPAMDTLPLENARVRVDNTTNYHSNASGVYTTASLSTGSHALSFRLEGPNAKVMSNTGADYTVAANANAGTTRNQLWTATDQDHINVFYHINLLHDWYVDHLGYSWNNPWTNTAQFRAEVNYNEDNAYAGDPMEFGHNCYARSSDIVYHECSHNVLYETFNDDWVGFSVGRYVEAYAFDEGFADFFACACTNDSMQGEGCGGGRSLDNNRQYQGKSAYNLEGHTGGTLIAGAAWDLRQHFAREHNTVESGTSSADNLIFDALGVMATKARDYYFSDPQESNFLTSLYEADDDNGSITDGVPHFMAIHRAFANHDLLQAVLVNGNSYDVSANTVGALTGGDFYTSNGSFYANNYGQKGLYDCGTTGTLALSSLDVPDSLYYKYGVAITAGHTYVSKAMNGEPSNYIAFQVLDYNATSKQTTIRYFYHTRRITLASQNSFDFSDQVRHQVTGGDFYFLDNKFWANNAGMRGVRDLGDLGGKALQRVSVPRTGTYNRFGVSAVAGHTYVSLAQDGEGENVIVFRVVSLGTSTVTIEYLYEHPYRVTLYPSNSYGFSSRTRGEITGGDLYYFENKFWANNAGQEGVVDAGNTGATPLADVTIPETGFTKSGVSVVNGHTYVTKDQTLLATRYTVFKVVSVQGTAVTVEYYNKTIRNFIVRQNEGWVIGRLSPVEIRSADFYVRDSRFMVDAAKNLKIIDLGPVDTLDLCNFIPPRLQSATEAPVVKSHVYMVTAADARLPNPYLFRVAQVTDKGVEIEVCPEKNSR